MTDYLPRIRTQWLKDTLSDTADLCDEFSTVLRQHLISARVLSLVSFIFKPRGIFGK